MYDHLPLIEFSYNNNYQSSIQIPHSEDLYGRRCRYPIGWFKVGEVGLARAYINHETIEKVKLIQEGLKTAQSHKKSYNDVWIRVLLFKIKD